MYRTVHGHINKLTIESTSILIMTSFFDKFCALICYIAEQMSVKYYAFKNACRFFNAGKTVMVYAISMLCFLS